MVTKFRMLFEDYESYSDQDFLMTKVSPRLINEVSKVLLMGLRRKVNSSKTKSKFELDNSLKNMCNIVCDFTNTEKTSNWGWYFLIEDYEAAFQCFLFEPLDKFMDAVSIIAIDFLNGLVIEDLNIIFSENNFGYRITNNPEVPWVTVKSFNGNYQVTHGDLTDLKNLCQQTQDYINNKKIELIKVKNNNERKEIIYDCLDSFQGLLLKSANTKNIENAIEIFIARKDIWGPPSITHDGITDILKLLKDFQSTNNINEEQFIYFIDRILIYINYICRISKNL